MILKKIKQALKDPKILTEYLNFIIHSGNPKIYLYNQVYITNFTDFSEYHSFINLISFSEISFLKQISLQEGVVIDVGGNLGAFSLLFAEFYKKSVYSFEPNPSTYSSLVKNISLNGKRQSIEAICMALSDKVGELSFYSNPKSRATARLNLNPSSNPSDNEVKTVKCTTLDQYLEDKKLDKIAFLKVDVEGYEELVFQGAINSLKQHKVDVIYYEVCPYQANTVNLNPKTPSQILLDNSYKLYKLNHNGKLLPADINDISTLRYENWVALSSKVSMSQDMFA